MIALRDRRSMLQAGDVGDENVLGTMFAGFPEFVQISVLESPQKPPPQAD
jgi:hypothetical protein